MARFSDLSWQIIRHRLVASQHPSIDASYAVPSSPTVTGISAAEVFVFAGPAKFLGLRIAARTETCRIECAIDPIV